MHNDAMLSQQKLQIQFLTFLIFSKFANSLPISLIHFSLMTLGVSFAYFKILACALARHLIWHLMEFSQAPVSHQSYAYEGKFSQSFKQKLVDFL